MGVRVSYDWSGNYGLLAEIEGAPQYLTTSGKTYVPQVQPLYADARLNGTVTAANVRIFTSENEEKKKLGRNYGISEGFW